MFDIDEARSVKNGIAADLSGWPGINLGGYTNMKIMTKETIEEPSEEQNINNGEIEISSKEIPREFAKEENTQKETNKNAKPGMEFQVNPIEMKNLAVRLLPTVDKLETDDYTKICAKAIEYAFTFENVWNEMIKGA